jgi:hypothetical protein
MAISYAQKHNAAYRREQRHKRLVSFYKSIFDSDDDISGDDDAGRSERATLDRQEDAREGDVDTLPPHALEQLADLVVEAADHPSVDRPQALRWLIHHPRGRVFAQQHQKALAAREDTTMTTISKAGPVAFDKRVVATSSLGETITEHEFVAAFGKDFVKACTAQDDDGLAIRKALDLIKQAQFYKSRGPEPHLLSPLLPASLVPEVATGRAAQNVDMDKDYVAEIEAVARRQGKSFSQVYESNEGGLASLERRQARMKLAMSMPLMPR